MIRVVYDGNLGNNLFQYAFGRLLAEQLGLRLDAPPIPGFPRTRDSVEGLDLSGAQAIVLRGQQPRIPESPSSSILLTGYFQRAEYYTRHRDKLRQWFTSDYKISDFQPDEDDLVVGIRRGKDYIPYHGLPSSYYLEAIESIPHKKVYICSDSPNDPFVKKISKKVGGSIREAGALDNLAFIRGFSKIVISNSTFLWWAAFLSDAKRVIGPRPANGFWSSADPLSRGISLEVDLPAYRYIKCAPYKSESLAETLGVATDTAVRTMKASIRSTFGLSVKREESVYHFGEEPERGEA